MISVLAMSLLVIGAAQAQEQDQVRKMFVHMNDGRIMKFKVADIQDVTFEMDNSLSDVPTTIEEAKDILLGSYWKIDMPLEDNEDIDGAYITIGNDPLVLYWVKVKDSCTNELFAPYAGKIVLLSNLGFILLPTPTVFNIISNEGGLSYLGTNLQRDSFDLTHYLEAFTWHCVRIEPFDPSEIVIPPVP